MVSLKIGPIGFAFEVDDFADFPNAWAFVLTPEISFYPMDNAEITFGVRWDRRENRNYLRAANNRKRALPERKVQFLARKPAGLQEPFFKQPGYGQFKI